MLMHTLSEGKQSQSLKVDTLMHVLRNYVSHLKRQPCTKQDGLHCGVDLTKQCIHPHTLLMTL